MHTNRIFRLISLLIMVALLASLLFSTSASRAAGQSEQVMQRGNSKAQAWSQWQARAKAGTCTDLMNAALEATALGCASTGRNQACIGNMSLKAELQPGVADIPFNEPGQTLPLTALRKLELASFDTVGGTWGVALLRIQANLPDNNPDQNVTMLLFGDVSIEDSSAPELSYDVITTADVLVRQTPENYGVAMGRLLAGSRVKATGRLSDATWVRLAIPDGTGRQGWIPSSHASIRGSISSLAILKANTPIYRSYQAFTVHTGTSVSPCSDAPRDGMIVQTPKVKTPITLNINGADVTLGSTLVIRSLNSTILSLSVIEGLATVESAGKQQTLAAGMQLELDLNTQGKVVGPPGPPHPYQPEDVNGLPVNILPIKIVTNAPQACQSGIPQTVTYRLPPLPPGSKLPPGIKYQQSGTYSAACYCANGFYTITKPYVTEKVCN